MSRSTKKGPYVDDRLLVKIAKHRKEGKKQPIKTWARSSVIIPDWVGLTFQVHNGKKFVPVYISEAMVGYRLGEFSPTRFFKGHGVGKRDAVALAK
ncbi:30S ribosomal protein S19 [bacterium]|nr:30S ribosomal protein S19 [bacterium]MBU3955744.1 30S ribosomal protein S19 [bacterium]MBU4133909.1 30S ribosomal protein S19 [bacterium]